MSRSDTRFPPSVHCRRSRAPSSRGCSTRTRIWFLTRRWGSWNAPGLGVALDYALSWGLDAINERVTTLADRLRALLGELAGVRVHDQGWRRCGIVTFTIHGVPAQEVQQRLAQHGVNTSVSLVEYVRLDLPDRGLPDLVRASVHYYNTEDELQRLIDALPPPR